MPQMISLQVTEIRKTVRDSEEGVDKMSIMREMGDKSQVITKQRNRETGDVDEEKELVNLDEGKPVANGILHENM